MAYGSISADTITSSTGQVFSPASSIMRNRIINGGMTINQRFGTGTTTPTGDAYVIDRWVYATSTSSQFTFQQNAGSVTPPVGFTNYLGTTVASSASISSGTINSLQQRIEGYNFQDLGWGTANAKPITISFWVYSNQTGLFGGIMTDSGIDYAYGFTYSIPVANTWTYCTVTIPGATAGSTWNTGSSSAARFMFNLGTGSTYQISAGSWQSGSGGFAYSVTNTVNLSAISSATWYITGVQLEAGSVASQFEYRQYGTELALCQRYYQTIANYTGNSAGTTNTVVSAIPFTVSMRTNPTLSVSGALGVTNYGTASFTQSAGQIAYENTYYGNTFNSMYVSMVNYSGLTSQRAYISYNSPNVIQLNSEL